MHNQFSSPCLITRQFQKGIPVAVPCPITVNSFVQVP